MSDREPEPAEHPTLPFAPAPQWPRETGLDAMPFGAPPLRPDDPDATVFLPRVGGLPTSPRWPVADPDALRPYESLATRMLPRVPPPAPAPETTAAPAAPSLARSSATMAIASLASRITGFFWKVMLVWAIGTGTVNDSFTIANTMPNILFELLFGGVLTSVVVPLLVRAQDDEDRGEAYTQRMLTVGLVVLLAGTAVAVVAAPAFTSLYIPEGSHANAALTTAFARLVLPEVFFYGLFALLSAVLNAKNLFRQAAWAPVANNLVVIATIAVFMAMPGQISLDPVRMGEPKLLVLGIGVTAGIAVQAGVLVPAVVRSGFRFRWRWGLDARMKEFGGLALWVLAYVVASQIAVTVTTRVLATGDPGGVAIYANAWLLFQLPYGVIGVSLLTAIMPRLSRNAADGDTRKVVADLSYGSRIATVLLVPIAAVLTVIGVPLGIAIFHGGANSAEDAARLGQALAVSAFGLLPYALVMLQLRVFYAMKDARTPTLIMAVMTVVKVPLLYLCPLLLEGHQVLLGVMLINSLTFVIGAVVGQVWLWVSLGHLRSKRALGIILWSVAASALGVLVAVLAGMLLPEDGGRIMAGVKAILQSAMGLGVAFGVLYALKIEELAPATKRLARLFGRAKQA